MNLSEFLKVLSPGCHDNETICANHFFYTASKCASDDKHIRENIINIGHSIDFSYFFENFKFGCHGNQGALPHPLNLHIMCCYYQRHVIGKVWSQLYIWLKRKRCFKYFQPYKEMTPPSGGHIFSPISIIYITFVDSH